MLAKRMKQHIKSYKNNKKQKTLATKTPHPPQAITFNNLEHYGVD